MEISDNDFCLAEFLKEVRGKDIELSIIVTGIIRQEHA
jgi:hypothetical protein